MKRIIKKVLSTTLIALMVCSIFMIGNVNALGVYKNASDFDGSAPPSVINMTKKFADNVIVIIRIVGVALAMGILLIIAMKYMTAAPSEKADLKKYAINYTIAAVIIFGASNLISVIYELSKVIK